MYIPKRYGESKKQQCPFCGKVAIVQNRQGIPVCTVHRERQFPEVKCACGKWLELLAGKWGPYFRCINCGNVSWSKGMELADLTTGSAPLPAAPSAPSRSSPKEELVVRSDDPRYFE